MGFDFNKFFDIVYNENEASKMISMSLSGIVGLVVYFLTSKDFAIALFATIIIFPLIKVICNKFIQYKQAEKASIDYQKVYENLLEKERNFIFLCFVSNDAEVIDWRVINKTREAERTTLISLVV
jgi:hypothetical protein